MRNDTNGSTSALKDALAPRAEELRAGRSRVMEDFRRLADDVESVLRTAGDASREGFGAARSQLEQSLRTARSTLSDKEDALRTRLNRASHAAGDYVTEKPVTTLLLAVAVGALVAWALTRRPTSDDGDWE